MQIEVVRQSDEARPAVRVKICGITRLEDAVAALTAGADYLGFILYPPSPRYVNAERVAALVAEVRVHASTRALFARPAPPLLVGVFVNETPDHVATVLDACRLDLVQLSGDEDVSYVTDPASPLFGRAYKAIRPRTLSEANTQSNYYANITTTMSSRPQLLLDAPHQTLYGGTGETGDWDIATEVARMLPGLMLAGGLTPDNVAMAVAQVRPFAVDVAGGVEIAPGQKDHDKIVTFIRKAKGA